MGIRVSQFVQFESAKFNLYKYQTSTTSPFEDLEI